jgi:toxin ParE1/3/4
VKRASVSREGEADIDGIVAYTANWWGLRQADRYLGQVEDCIQLLAEHPSVGRSCDRVQMGLRRFEVGRHVVFHRIKSDNIRVIRVLHQQMLPAKSHFAQ